jgi:hypothetical protein
MLILGGINEISFTRMLEINLMMNDLSSTTGRIFIVFSGIFTSSKGMLETKKAANKGIMLS